MCEIKFEESTGAKTQVTSLISSVVVLLTIFLLGEYLSGFSQWVWKNFSYEFENPAKTHFRKGLNNSRDEHTDIM